MIGHIEEMMRHLANFRISPSGVQKIRRYGAIWRLGNTVNLKKAKPWGYRGR